MKFVILKNHLSFNKVLDFSLINYSFQIVGHLKHGFVSSKKKKHGFAAALV